MAMLTEEQTMLRDTAREWAQNEAPVSAFRKVRDGRDARGFDPALYRRMAEMGWTGIVVPETYGGSGMNVRSLGLVLQETGKTLTASPLLASALAAIAIARAGGEAQKQTWLPKIASGETIATLAVDEGPRHDPEKIETRAEPSGAGWKLTGAKAFVAEGDSAGLFIVAARTGKGVALFLVPADAKGVARSPRRMTDARSHADVRFSDVLLGADSLLGDEDGKQLIEEVLDCARAVTAAEMLGMAEQAFQTTLDYLKTRVQFGQPLSTFQALQHRMANLFTEIELARSAVEGALDAVDFGAGAGRLVSLAKARANDTLHLASNEMVQLHGGIGMTDEHDAGFYLKRARVLEGAWGNSAFHRDRFARLSNY
jgi:alkylation response protein AidB-like acyl-CoA dehydrogenase